MIGNSVVPGLPHRCVMPSSFRSARNAERPVKRFLVAMLAEPRLQFERGQATSARCGCEALAIGGCVAPPAGLRPAGPTNTLSREPPLEPAASFARLCAVPQ